MCPSWMSVLSDSPACFLHCGATEEQRPWDWADHGLVKQREEWREGGPAWWTKGWTWI